VGLGWATSCRCSKEPGERSGSDLDGEDVTARLTSSHRPERLRSRPPPSQASRAACAITRTLSSPSLCPRLAW
jgi:hypothetical protein